jgi:hypothetical protein
LHPFKTLFQQGFIIDEQIFDSKTVDKLMEGIEEFALFFMKNFRGQLDMTYFFYRSLYGQFSFNLENAIKVLYCLHKMTPEEGLEGVQEDDANSADDEQDEAAQYGLDEEDDSYGDYDEEEDYGDEGESQEQEDEENAMHINNHS